MILYTPCKRIMHSVIIDTHLRKNILAHYRKFYSYIKEMFSIDPITPTLSSGGTYEYHCF